MADLKKDMEKGLITFDMVEDAFKTATSEGGRFFGMLEQQSETVSGKLSTMNDAIDTAAGSLTESFGPAIKGFADVVTALAGGFAELPAGIRALAGAIAILGGAALAAIPVMNAFGVSLAVLSGPVGAIAAVTAGVIALGVAISASINEYQLQTIEKYKDAFGDIGAATGVAEEGMDKFAKQSQKALGSLGALTTKFATPEKIQEIAKSLGLTASQVAMIGLESDKINPKIKEVLKSMVDERDVAQQILNIRIKEGEELQKYYELKYPDIAKRHREEKAFAETAKAKAAEEKKLAEEKAKKDAEAAAK
jgi:hypothetical protein